jgi:hypothetical protein
MTETSEVARQRAREVERFQIGADSFLESGPTVTDGQYVGYSDYAALVSQLSAKDVEIERLRYALTQISEGRFRHNMGDFEACAKRTASLAIESLLNDKEKNDG